MLVLGDMEHEGRKEGVATYNELKKVEAQMKSSVDDNQWLQGRVAMLEQELEKVHASKDNFLWRVKELEAQNIKFEASKSVLWTEVVESFRASKQYTKKLSVKSVAKIQDTYVVAEKYLKKHPNGGFDGFVEVFMAAEEQKLQEPKDSAPSGTDKPVV